MAKGMTARLRRDPGQRPRSRSRTRLAVLASSSIAALAIASALPTDAAPRAPWEGLEDPGSSLAPIGMGFDVTPRDLEFILEQIKIGEAHAASRTPLEPCSTLIGPGPNQIPEGGNAHEFPFGIRTVSGECNNLLPGQETWGAADQVFPRLAPADFRGDYTNPSGNINDPEPRVASNLIVDQTDTNAAAVAAAGGDPDPLNPGTEVEILNTAPDAGLSAPYNSMLTFFGQFFDHGLDLVKKNGSELVVMALDPSDPLYNPAPGAPNFMLLNRTVTTASDAGVNATTPYVDQNQTYSSHPSKQVFLRQYALNGLGQPVSTGKLIEGVSGGMATWGELKTATATLLGIQLVDMDVHSVPMILTDPYGNFIPGPNGFPQLVTGSGLVEGNPAANGGLGVLVPNDIIPSGHSFLDDIAHAANVAPGLSKDADAIVNPLPLGAAYTPNPGATLYDNEMLDAHYMAGDGRVNENIALISVHHVFHSEHNRVADDIVNTLLTNPDITPAFRAEWQIGTDWNGQRLFQAAKLVTEMEYQHLVFEEFARFIQPNINAFVAYDSTINAAINAEFAHSVYRFGHSMLNTDVARFTASGTNDDIALFDAFLNPPAWLDGTYATAEEAAGAVFRGGVAQQGSEIDEFVVEALRNQLLGLPLDLPALNMARGRDTGVPRLNQARRDFYAQTNNDPSLRPYDSWLDFSFEIKHQESLVNFIAAYGTHPTIASAGNNFPARRLAAQNIVNNITPDAADFMVGTGAWQNVAGLPTTGLENIDLWVGGLAEKKQAFGGMLGTTFNYVFEKQLEDLQSGDRFYYLGRLAGEDLLAALEGNSFSELVMRNTDAEGLPAQVFTRPTYTFNVAALGTTGPVLDDPATGYNESVLLVRLPNGTIRYPGEEHVNWIGSPNADRLSSGDGDDTVRGNNANDRLEGGIGNDDIIGGEGNDILTDSFGIDTLKGGPGNDALAGGPGLGDLLQGGNGHDFIVGGNDGTTTLAGEGNDFIYAGSAADIVTGDFGDDWMEGGADADALTGDAGNPFLNDPAGGDDVLLGGASADIGVGEGGTDIFVHDSGTDDNDGGLGFDFYTHYGDPLPGDSDLAVGELVPAPIDPLRDRFNLIEALSGYNQNDILRGDGANPLDIGGNDLTADGIALIPGLADVLPAGATGFVSGNIILGGAGSDLIEGRADDDIIDGDAWLRVQLEHNGIRYDTLSQLQAAVFAGTIDPGTISIVREILPGTPGSDIDTALFQGPRADYDITFTPDGVRVTHARGTGGPVPDVLNDGSDLLNNIEQLQFSDQTLVLGAQLCAGLAVTVDLGLGGVPTAGDDVIMGTAGADVINALGGNDTVCGNGGIDTINGAEGNDSLYGGDGNDILTGGIGSDQLYGDANDDTLNGGEDADYLVGAAGNDTLNGDNGDDYLDGGDNNDTLNGGRGGDQLFGYGGDDTLNGEAVGVVLGEPDYLWGGLGIDTYNGGAGNDWLDGGDEAETMNGDAGDDVILARDGADTLNGGTGLDYLWGGLGTDTFNGGADRDTLDGNDGTENAGEVMNGDGGDDDILGYGGNDTINGGAGSDYLWGGTGVDTFNGGTERDHLEGDDNGEVMNGDDGDDLLIGWGGTDTLNGGLGSDYMWGGLGIDTYNGGDGADYLDGNDTGENAGETMNGDAGDDLLIGWGGNDTLNGGTGADYLWGSTGTDTLNGGPDAIDICIDPQNGTFDPSCEATGLI
ncbi:MAG: peroxidase family protein [Acidimicrobiia bacterium]